MKSRDYSTTLRELLASAQRKYPGPSTPYRARAGAAALRSAACFLLAGAGAGAGERKWRSSEQTGHNVNFDNVDY
jgi:hypothetical protein